MTDPSDPDTMGVKVKSFPSPDATKMETEDVLVWDERNPWCHVHEWPTRSQRTFFLVPPFEKNPTVFSNWGFFCRILDDGWKVASCTIVKHGFLCLKESKVWTMTRRVEWLRDGSETSFTGYRVTPSVFRIEDENKTWTDR